MSRPDQRTPMWMTALILIFLLPTFAFSLLLSNLPYGDEAVRTFVWIYPFYMLFSAWLSWTAYPTRSYLSWILLILMGLSTAAIWMLVLNPVELYPA